MGDITNLAPNPIENSIIDLSLSQVGKKSIRIDGDDNRILMLNISDLGVMVRLKDCYPKMIEMAQKASLKLAETAVEDSNEDEDSEENRLRFDAIAETLRETDAEMRGYIDYIFDSNVSEICAPSGSMYDPHNGKFQFEIIIEALSSLYEDNISLEYRKMSARLKAHTSKYTMPNYGA